MLEGPSAREAMRFGTVRAEWSSGDTTAPYFDYVLENTIKG